MAKFLFYTDIHFSGKSPRNRIDDFPQTLVDKLKCIYETAEKEGCEYLMFGGDFFNSHRVFSYEIINEVMDVICNSKLMTYCIIGQHDLVGYNPKSYKSSTLAFVIKHCPMFEVMWDAVEFDDLVVYPCHVWDDVFETSKIAKDENCKGKDSVMIAHHLLMEKEAIFEVIKTSDLADCPFNLVLSGDLHCGYKEHEISGTRFYNPGSIARQTIKDVDRFPTAVLVEIDNGKVTLTDKPLDVGKIGSDVFDDTVGIMDIIKESPVLSESFIDGISDLESESTDVFELIEKIGKKEGLKGDVLAHILSKKSILESNAE